MVEQSCFRALITLANLDADGALTDDAIDTLDIFNATDTDDGITDNPDGIFIV